MRTLCVVDWPETGRWIWGCLPQGGECFDIYALRRITPFRSRLGKLTTYRWRYLWASLAVLSRLRHYDVVMTWETKCGLPIALYQTICHRRQPAHIIVGLIMKGALRQPHRWARILFSSVAAVVCFSRGESRHCAQMLGLPPERVRYLPLAWDVREDADVSPAVWVDFVLSVGSSGRDYATLFSAATAVATHFVVVARPANLAGLQAPPNVEVRYNIPSHEVTALMRVARLVVVPLDADDYSAGQSVIIRAMSAARAVVASRTEGTIDYIQDGQTGLLVTPHDPQALALTINHLLADVPECERLGRAARRAAASQFGFEQLARRLADLAMEVADQNQTTLE